MTDWTTDYGGGKYYYGIDTTSLWHQVGRTVAVNGISVKVLEPNKAGSHSIPMFANTSEAYARTDQSGRIVQLRLFNHNGTPSVDLKNISKSRNPVIPKSHYSEITE